MEKKKVKKYILDNVVMAALYAGLAISVPFIRRDRGVIFVLVVEAVFISLFALGFRRIFFFPFDLLIYLSMRTGGADAVSQALPASSGHKPNKHRPLG